MSLNKTYLISFITFFFLVYGVKISFGVTIYSVQVSLVFFCMAFVLHLLKTMKMDVVSVKYLLYITPYFLYSLFYSSFLATYQDRNVLIGSMLFLLVIVASLHIAKFHFSKLSEEKILNIIFTSTTFFSFIILLIVAVEPFKNFIYAMISVDATFVELSGKYRVVAPNAGAGAYLSTVLAIGQVSGVLISKSISSMRFFVSTLIIILSIIFIGRTGLLILFLILPIIYFLKNSNKPCIVTLFKIIFLILLGFLILMLLYVNSDSFVTLHPAFLRLMRMVSPIVEGGLFNDPTIQHLLERHYFLPNNTNDLLFGIGTTGRSEEQTGILIPSDVGFVRLLFSLGIFGSFFLYLFYFIIAYNSFRNIKKSILMKFTFIASIFIFLFHLKEVGYGTIVLSLMLLIPYFSYLFIEKKQV
jgi:hypothetical protein